MRRATREIEFNTALRDDGIETEEVKGFKMSIYHKVVHIPALMAASLLIAACSPESHQPDSSAATETGDPQIEMQYGALTDSETRPGAEVYVAADRLRVRTSPETNESNIAGVLDVNDRVEIVSAEKVGPQEFVQIRIVTSKNTELVGQTLYTSAKYLNATQVPLDTNRARASKYFMVINLATEKLRVYRQCEAREDCVNKMVFEQDVVGGEDDDGTRTDVGVFRITSWEKFYEIKGTYPAWYRPGYPDVPKPGASMRKWFSKKYMPNRKGDMRGAFGWYTAKIGPNPRGQWVHGTAGWGSDKKKFILFKQKLRARFVNLFASIRSHGCVRIDNESIAYLRSLLPVGTTVVKIYAKEGLRRSNPVGYSSTLGRWPYVMTKNHAGVTNNHELAEAASVYSSGTPVSQWLEQGTLELDQYPDPVPFNSRRSKSLGGDLYKLGESAMRGVFLVDEGTVVDYRHPHQLYTGGYRDQVVPSTMLTSDRSYHLP